MQGYNLLNKSDSPAAMPEMQGAFSPPDFDAPVHSIVHCSLPVDILHPEQILIPEQRVES